MYLLLFCYSWTMLPCDLFYPHKILLTLQQYPLSIDCDLGLSMHIFNQNGQVLEKHISNDPGCSAVNTKATIDHGTRY